MIFFGTRGVTGTKATGQFHCPQCGQVRAYQHQQARQFFTLYFIPIFPVKTLGEWVECKVCNGQFKPEVLKYKPETETK